MPVSCAAINCKNRFTVGSTITFHNFPIYQKEKLQRWLWRMKRDDFVPTKSTKICSKHFEPECFRRINDRSYLREESEPTIFDFSLPQKRTQKKKALKRTASSKDCPPTRKSSRTASSNCCALNCTSSKDDDGINNFRFPLDEDLCKRWAAAARKNAWKPTTSSFLCSRHFDESCFKMVKGRAVLHEEAVPTIFDFVPRSQDNTPRKRKVLKAPESRHVMPRDYETSSDESSESEGSARYYVWQNIRSDKAPSVKPIMKTLRVVLTDIMHPNRSSNPDSSSSRMVKNPVTPTNVRPLSATTVQPAAKSPPQKGTAAKDSLTPSNSQPTLPNTTVSRDAVEKGLQLLFGGNDDVVLTMPGPDPSFKIIKMPSNTPVPMPASEKNLPKWLNQQMKPNLEAWIQIVEAAIKHLQTSKNEFVLLRIRNKPPTLKVLKLSKKTSLQDRAMNEKQKTFYHDHNYRVSSDCTCTCLCTKCKLGSKYHEQYKEKAKLLRVASQRTTRQLSKIANLEAKIAWLRKRIQSTRDEPPTVQQAVFALKEHLTENVYEFLMAQLLAKLGQRKYGKVWPPDLKDLVLSMHRDSPRTFRMMRKIFEVPSLTTLSLHENQITQLMHLDNEMQFTTVQLDEDRKQVMFDDDETDNNVTIIVPRVEQPDSTLGDVISETIGMQPEAESDFGEEHDGQARRSTREPESHACVPIYIEDNEITDFLVQPEDCEVVEGEMLWSLVEVAQDN